MKGRSIDPRAKLYLLLLGNLTLLFHVSLTAECMLMGMLLLLILAGGRVKSFLRLAAAYSLLTVLQICSVSFPQNPVISLAAMLAVGIRMMLPCITAGAYAFTTTTMGEFVCAMRLLHITESIIITCSVVIRFFPTIAEDCRQIRNAMRLRGMDGGCFVWLLHPFRTLEYVLIPLLMNSSYVAQDLSVAALTKGIGIKGRHTCLTQLRMRWYDWLTMLVCTLPIALDIVGVI